MADNPSLDEVARSRMGMVSARVKEYSSKPIIPPRKPKQSNYSPNTETVQNGSPPVDQSSTDMTSTGPKLRVVEKKNKFRHSTPISPGEAPPSKEPNTNGTESKVGPTVTVVSPELTQSGTLQKAVCVTHEQKFETVTEISLKDVSLHITNSNQSSPALVRRALSPSSPECLDSSFDEMTSDEDEAADREMGVQVPLPSPKPEEGVKQKSSRAASGRRERSSLLLKEQISLSPSQKRKHIESLSESFKPGSPTVARSQTFNEKSPRQKEKLLKHSGTVKHRSSVVSTGSDSVSNQSLGSFVFVDTCNSTEQTYSRMRVMTELELTIATCNDLPRAISTLPNDKRHHVIQEIYSSEWTYVNGLEILVQVFRTPLKSVLNARELDSIFANVEDLLLFNLGLLSKLHERLSEWDEKSTIGDIFISKFTHQHKTMYTVYCNNYDNAEQVLLKLMKRRKDFETAVNSCLSNPRVMKGLRTDSFLITPVQRITKYKLLIEDLIKSTPSDHEDYVCLEGALHTLTELAEYMNAQRLEVETVQKVESLRKKLVGIMDISKNRVIIKEGTICLQSIRKPYKCILFNDLLVFALSRDRESRQIVELQLPLEAVWVDDLKDLDPQGSHEDAIEIFTPDRPYRLYTGSKNDKKLWLTALKETIYNLLLKQEKCAESAVKDITHRNATFVYATSNAYMGDFCDGRRHGYGEMFWPNKTVYKGYWEDDERSGKGELTYNTGEVYNGGWRDDKQNGIGTIRYNNEDEYRGSWYDGIKHGLGDIFYSNKDRFQGTFKTGQIHGRGKLTCANGLTYDGEWHNSQRSGKGKLSLVTGDVYEGDFFNNLIHGNGMMKYANGDEYDGQWVAGLRKGKGKLVKKNGEVYEGLWENDMRTGMGTAAYPNKDVYEGLWLNGLRHGQGRMTFTNGDVYTGKFDHNVISGEGEMRYKDGGRYNGAWKNGKHHGYGVKVYFDKATYNGEWRHGLRSGEGEHIACDGTSYSGHWQYDKPHGRGKLITPCDEYSYDGEWVHGLREGKGYEVTRCGVHEGDWRSNSKHGSGTERSLVGTVFEGRWLYNQKSSRGVRKMVHGEQQDQVWSNGNLLSDSIGMVCVELPQLPRIDN